MTERDRVRYVSTTHLRRTWLHFGPVGVLWQAKAMAAAPTPAIAVLERAKISYHLREYHHDAAVTAFGDEAVSALGVDPARTFKTLIADVSGIGLVVGVVPVAGHMNLKALAKAVGGKKAVMAEVAIAERSSGYVHGGISPLGQRRQLPTVIDHSASDFDTIYVSAGKRGLQMELAAADLARAARASFAAIAADGAAH